jgi:hypothetical protein
MRAGRCAYTSNGISIQRRRLNSRSSPIPSLDEQERNPMTYQAGETLIYDNIYPVRFEKRQDATLAVVSEDGGHFFARWDQLRRPTPEAEFKNMMFGNADLQTIAVWAISEILRLTKRAA